MSRILGRAHFPGLVADFPEKSVGISAQSHRIQFAKRFFQAWLVRVKRVNRKRSSWKLNLSAASQNRIVSSENREKGNLIGLTVKKRNIKAIKTQLYPQHLDHYRVHFANISLCKTARLKTGLGKIAIRPRLGSPITVTIAPITPR